MSTEPLPEYAGNTAHYNLSGIRYVLDDVARPKDRSTCGLPLSCADEYALQQQLGVLSKAADLDGNALAARAEPMMMSYQRDKAIAEASRRWSGVPLRPQQRDYRPGDVCGLRASACEGSLVEVRKIFADPERAMTPSERTDLHVQLAEAVIVYDAVPYYLPLRSTLGITGSEPPSPDLLADLHLPFPRVAVFFGADLSIPPTYVGGEELASERLRWLDEQKTAGATELPAHLAPPVHLAAPLLALRHRNDVRIAGVLLIAGHDGSGLADVLGWFTSTPTELGIRRVNFGFLSAARMRPIVLNLAAAVAWGDWQPPAIELELPSDPGSRAFRDAVRRGQFRRREPSGAAVSVRVLDARRPQTARPAGGGSHASPVTHLRRGYWKRQRHGPRDDWRYEPRHIDPTVVNPAGSQALPVTVYRLPDPPDERAPS